MSLYKQITEIYSQLTDADFAPSGKINLRDDGDGIVYIAKWDYEKPIPEGLSLGKQTA